MAAGISGADMKGVGIGALTGGMFGGLHLSQLSGFQHTLAHGAVGGLGSLLGGEGFQSGFMSSFFTAHMGRQMDAVGGGILAQAVMSAIVGGSAAEIGGGKFSNGALTGAMSRLLNHCGGNRCEGARKRFSWRRAAEFAFNVGTFFTPAGWAAKGILLGAKAVSGGRASRLFRWFGRGRDDTNSADRAKQIHSVLDPRAQRAPTR